MFAAAFRPRPAMTILSLNISATHLLYLALSIAILLAGPLVYRLLERVPKLRRVLDAFVLLSVGAMVVVFVAPEMIETAGWWAMVVMLFGLLFPMALERLAGIGTRRTHATVLVLALVGLTLHTAMDGAVIGGGHGHAHDTPLALAVALHRFPVGLAVWALVKPRYGTSRAIAVLGLVILSTIAGFIIAETATTLMPDQFMALVQSFVAGSLLHVFVHAVGHDHDHGHEH